MNKTLVSMFLACSFLNAFSMETNPAAAWRALMARACKTGKLDQQALARTEAQAVAQGYRRTDMVEPKECKPFFDQAGAQSDCPYMFGVSGPVPLYDYRRCHYTKFFENK